MSSRTTHSVTYHTSTTSYEPGNALPWHARCCCGERSDRAPGYDGVLDTARRWAREHYAAQRPQGPQPPNPPPLDEPDPTPDSYDAWLRGVTDGGR